LPGFAKSARELLVDRRVVMVRRAATSWLSANPTKMKQAVEAGEFKEIRDGRGNKTGI
jgi:hypothetical protein